jgi:hypothetical protein
MAKPDKKDTKSSTIALNKKARHDFFIEERLEARADQRQLCVTEKR